MFRRSTGSCLVSIRRDGKALWLADKQAVFMIHPHWLSPWLFVYLQACACASLCVLLCFPVAFKFLYNSGLHKGSFVQWGFFLFYIYNFFVKLNTTSFVLQFNKEERKKAVCCMCSVGQDAPTAFGEQTELGPDRKARVTGWSGGLALPAAGSALSPWRAVSFSLLCEGPTLIFDSFRVPLFHCRDDCPPNTVVIMTGIKKRL